MNREVNELNPETTPPAGAVEPAHTESMRILEAVLFASEELVSMERLKEILPDRPDARKIRRMADDLNALLQRQRHPFEVVEAGGGFQLKTIAYYFPWIRQLFREKPRIRRLSVQALECLAIVAYKQPITRAEIEAIRGVMSEAAMKSLLERNLVTITGRSDKPGRPLVYGTTKDFLTYFSLNTLDDLPGIEEFEAIAREKMEELSEEELGEIGPGEGEEEQRESAPDPRPEGSGGGREEVSGRSGDDGETSPSGH